MSLYPDDLPRRIPAPLALGRRIADLAQLPQEPLPLPRVARLDRRHERRPREPDWHLLAPYGRASVVIIVVIVVVVVVVVVTFMLLLLLLLLFGLVPVVLVVVSTAARKTSHDALNGVEVQRLGRRLARVGLQPAPAEEYAGPVVRQQLDVDLGRVLREEALAWPCWGCGCGCGCAHGRH